MRPEKETAEITEKTAADSAKELAYQKKTVYQLRDEAAIDAAYDYANGYMKFLDDAKTEREAVTAGIALAEAEGFVPYQFGDEIVRGGKYYYNNRGKNLFLFYIGSDDIKKGIRISAAHIDSPRLATPLALHGVVAKKNGETVNVTIGEDNSDPVLYINDLLPHLGHGDDTKPLGSAIPGEKLNLLVGSRPLDDVSDGIKLNVLRILNEKYGIDESDLLSAELCAVPLIPRSHRYV